MTSQRITIKALLVLTLLVLGLNASAYDFMVDGLAYQYLNGPSGNEVEVTYTYSYNGYDGNYRDLTTANVPSSLTHNGRVYSVTSIGNNAFRHCDGLTSVSIGNSVTSIGEYAFYQCQALSTVNIPNSVTSISDYTFYGCSGLTSVTIPNSVTSIGAEAFSYCRFITSFDIPNSVTSIGGYAFRGCSGLTSVTIPNSVTSIGNGLLNECTELKSVTIGNSVTSIGAYTFSRCRGLKSVTIGYSVTSIGNYAFEDCSRLTEIRIKIVDVSNIALGYYDVFKNVPTTSCILKVPVGTSTAYRNAYKWKAFRNIKEVLFSSDNVGDLNCDNVVNGTDINIMVNQLLQTNAYEDEDGAADLDGDSETTALDLNRMIKIVLGQ